MGYTHKRYNSICHNDENLLIKSIENKKFLENYVNYVIYIYIYIYNHTYKI
jgi:hypothetical protein